MTIVECFDRDPVKNILSIAALSPSTVIMLSDVPVPDAVQARLRQYADNIGASCDLRFLVADINNVTVLTDTLSDIVERYSSLAFDITGGKEPMLAAVGAVIERYRGKKDIALHRFDLKTGMLYNAVDNSVIPCQKPTLTVEQLIALHGGAVGSRANGGMLTQHIFDDSLAHTLSVLWNINKENPSAYNKTVSTLREFEKYRAVSSSLRTVVNDHYAESRIERYRDKRALLTTFLQRIHESGVVTLHDTTDKLDFTYKDAKTKACLSKAGNLLEWKTLFASSRLTCDNGERLIGDAWCGVHIDWDGQFVDSESDTLNEIDVFLMKGAVPIFISCKNGTMDDKELYKLSTVAKRFGGDRAKAIVVGTYIEKNPLVRTAILQRASDMGIPVIADTHRLSDDEFERCLCEALTTERNLL